MADQKKIALLNMRFDSNYGGNLQRYAMVTTLQRMEYAVEYLYIRDNWDDWYTNRSTIKIIKHGIMQIMQHLRNPKTEPWLAWHRENTAYRDKCKGAESFLERYIPHTKVIYSRSELERVFKDGHYNAIIAGSDQIWRKEFVERYGLGMWFLDFVPHDFAGAKVIYGASFGVDKEEYSKQEAESLRPLFEQLTAVSVREKSGLDLLKKYKWTKPDVELVLDPTMLLTNEDYETLIENTKTQAADGDMFCYILDRAPGIDEKIIDIANKKGLKPHVIELEGSGQVSIEQWLRYIRDAKYVFTDSYHGLLFAIIFRKPFYLAYNSFRGNARFDSILDLLSISLEKLDYEMIYEKLELLRMKSIHYLSEALK